MLNPVGQQLRPTRGLVVHRREGAPLTVIAGRPATTAAWTAIEVARGLRRRPRALATLDAALRSGTCGRGELRRMLNRHAGPPRHRRGRELLPLASPLAESPMESEARLVMIDGGLPPPVLQYEIVDLNGETWRFDFAWPEVPRRSRVRRSRLAQRARAFLPRPPTFCGGAGPGVDGRPDRRRGRQIPARRTRRADRTAPAAGRVSVRRMPARSGVSVHKHARSRPGEGQALVPGPMLRAGRVRMSWT